MSHSAYAGKAMAYLEATRVLDKTLSYFTFKALPGIMHYKVMFVLEVDNYGMMDKVRRYQIYDNFTFHQTVSGQHNLRKTSYLFNSESSKACRIGIHSIVVST